MLIKFFEFSKNAIRNFKNDERGVTAIEYAIIGVAISAIILLMFNGTLQQALIDAIGTISANITSANDTGGGA
ncbi:Flp family type IVb pilin [Aliivibrio fischeri]|uniref:Flp family type IVb pilin n=1 Tax=Aliivibrio fischeri TaxID=668 RepID=UPI0007C54461|nr:Flp family type IVb pilin [Aliivibrio fischeri]MUJ27375.1 Flp family type IVb pilin [Aliivibrio fischeri]